MARSSVGSLGSSGARPSHRVSPRTYAGAATRGWNRGVPGGARDRGRRRRAGHARRGGPWTRPGGRPAPGARPRPQPRPGRWPPTTTRSSCASSTGAPGGTTAPRLSGRVGPSSSGGPARAQPAASPATRLRGLDGGRRRCQPTGQPTPGPRPAAPASRCRRLPARRVRGWTPPAPLVRAARRPRWGAPRPGAAAACLPTVNSGGLVRRSVMGHGSTDPLDPSPAAARTHSNGDHPG